MKTDFPDRFIVIDDDPICNLISTHSLKYLSSNSEVLCFNKPKDGFEFIITNYKTDVPYKTTVLFLDLNMPIISGFDFLNLLSCLDLKVIKQFTIFILSSSVDDSDIKKAKEFSIVKDYIIKPLTPQILKGIF